MSGAVPLSSWLSLHAFPTNSLSCVPENHIQACSVIRSLRESEFSVSTSPEPVPCPSLPPQPLALWAWPRISPSQGTPQVSVTPIPWGPLLRPSSEPPGLRCHQARKSNPTVTQNHSDFLNLEMNTNLPGFQKLKPSRRFTPPEGKASQQTKNITFRRNPSPNISSQNSVRPNAMPPNFWSWFPAFECEKEGTEESDQMGAGG